MIRSGKLDRIITIERAAETIDDAGTPSLAWATVATLRAEIVNQSVAEFIRDSAGAESGNTIIFRTHYLAGVTVSDRVSYDGQAFDIQETRELGRRRGLEIKCIARAA
jgi:SPP1 family predicted phage head-tail adaptor